MDVLKIICALFVPPLAVALHQRALTIDCVINLFLWLFMCWLPGSGHAIWILMQPQGDSVDT